MGIIGNIEHGSVSHALSWSSSLSSRPFKSIASAEVLAAGTGIDEGKVINEAYVKILDMQIGLNVFVDSKDLFSSLSTCRVPEDKSIRGGFALLRYNFETKRLRKLIWIPGSAILADPLTKPDSSLAQSVLLMLFDGTLPQNIDTFEIRESSAQLG